MTESVQPRRTLRLVVGAQSCGQRLDQFLADADEMMSRSFARKLIDIGGVHCNGRRVRKAGLPVSTGDQVVVNIDGLALAPYVLTEDDIIFADRYLLVLNKPAGIDSQPTPSRYKGTLYAAVIEYLKNPLRRDLQPTVGMVQRLDRDTSGLIVFSIHPSTHKKMSEAFSSRGVVKKYRALIAGKPLATSGEFSSQLARRRATNTMKTVEKGGREAITRYRVLRSNRVVTEVEVEIPTGRSHQIRAHFSEAGHPLLGDLRYGGPGTVGERKIDRQMLHACNVQMNHPKTGEKLDFVAELPYDMSALATTLFKDER